VLPLHVRAAVNDLTLALVASMLHHGVSRAALGPREMKTPALYCSSHVEKPMWKGKIATTASVAPALRTYHRSQTSASRLKGYRSATNQSTTRLGPRAVSVLREQPARSLSPSTRHGVSLACDGPERVDSTASEGASSATQNRREHTLVQQDGKPKQSQHDPQLVVDVDKHAVVQVLSAPAAW
jgi:hypothetical protein